MNTSFEHRRAALDALHRDRLLRLEAEAARAKARAKILAEARQLGALPAPALGQVRSLLVSWGVLADLDREAMDILLALAGALRRIDGGAA